MASHRPESPLIGPRHPFAGWSVPGLLDQQARRRPAQPFLIWEPVDGPPEVYSYGRFAAESQRLAGGLRRRGVRRGRSVIIHLDNCPELLLAWFACARLGAPAITTNTRSSAAELAYFIGHARPDGVVTSQQYAHLVEPLGRDLEWLAVTDGPVGGGESLGSFVDDTPFALEPVIDARDPLSVQYTSGTTARPKGVVWTHANALWGACVGARHEDLRPDDVHLVHLPLFHTNALSYSILSTLWVGATAVVVPRFSASRFWETSTRWRCTWTSMIPFCVRALQERPIPRHDYRFWGYRQCDMPWGDTIGVRSLGWWGMTETITHCIVGDAHHPNRPGSMGRPALGYEIEVRDQCGTLTEPGGTGELHVRGVAGLSIFAEYLRDVDATASAFDERGFLITGDRVTVHDDGHISFADRAKDMLKVGGENVAASEIEAVIASIDEVVEVAVVGEPDQMLDEVPVAFVVANGADPDRVIASVLSESRDRLAAFKVPRRVLVVDDLPRSTLNKVAKQVLRDQLRSMATASIAGGSLTREPE